MDLGTPRKFHSRIQIWLSYKRIRAKQKEEEVVICVVRIMLSNLKQNILFKEILFLTVIIIVSFLVKLQIPLKGDRSTYLEHFLSLQSTGKLFVPDLPVTIYLLFIVGSQIGFATAYQSLILIFYSLICIPIYYLTKNIYASEYAGVIAASLVVFNPYVIWMIHYGGFKAGLGHFFSFLSLYFLYKYERKQKYIILFGAFSVLTMLTHTLATALLIGYIVLFLIHKQVKHREQVNNEKIYPTLILYLFLLITILGLINISPYLSRYSKIVSLTRFGYTPFAKKILIDPVTFAITTFSIFSVFLTRKKNRPKHPFFITSSIICYLLYLLAFIVYSRGLGFRLLQLAYLPVALLMPFHIKKTSVAYLLTGYLILNGLIYVM